MESAAADETSQAENASVSQYSESAFASGASGTEGTQEETHAVPRRRRRLHRYVEKDNRVVLPPDVDALVFVSTPCGWGAVGRALGSRWPRPPI